MPCSRIFVVRPRHPNTALSTPTKRSGRPPPLTAVRPPGRSLASYRSLPASTTTRAIDDRNSNGNSRSESRPFRRGPRRVRTVTEPIDLPEGVERRSFDGASRLATRGLPVYGEPTDGEWRAWDPNRSKLAAMVELGFDLGMDGGPDERVLYLGAASGTTVSHVADFSGPTYAVEF